VFEEVDVGATRNVKDLNMRKELISVFPFPSGRTCPSYFTGMIVLVLLAVDSVDNGQEYSIDEGRGNVYD
jgi:hypothetical protein